MIRPLLTLAGAVLHDVANAIDGASPGWIPQWLYDSAISRAEDAEHDRDEARAKLAESEAACARLRTFAAIAAHRGTR